MIPVSVSLKGFMSYRDSQSIEFDGQSLWVLAGPNGAGKSAIFDAITFALYGQYRGGAQDAKGLINHDSDSLEVEFVFRVMDETYKVRRTLPLRGRPTWSAYQLVAGEFEPIEGADSVSASKEVCQRIVGLDYSAFTSSVLLLQGQSERLISSLPVERYKILADLIDLRPYQRLAERVEALRDRYELEVDSCGKSLTAFQVVGDDELEAARREAERSHDRYARAVEEVDLAFRILDGAQKWNELRSQREAKIAQRDKDLGLLARCDEIMEGAGTFRELSGILKSLQELVHLRLQLHQDQQNIEAITAGLVLIKQQAAAIDQAQGETAAQLEELAQRRDTAHSELERVQEQLAKLGPQSERLRQVDELQRQVAELAARLGEFPADLAEQLKRQREEIESIEDARHVLTGLRQFSGERVRLSEVQEKAALAVTFLHSARQQLHETLVRTEQLGKRVEAAELDQQQRQLEMTRLETRHAELRQRQARFEQVASTQQCEVCGQPVDEQHAAIERTRMAEQDSALRVQLDLRRQRLREAQQVHGELRAQLAQAEQRTVELKGQRAQHESAQQGAMSEISSLERKLLDAFEQLPRRYQLLIWPEPRASQVRWLETGYPSEDDLTALKQRAAQKAEQSRQLAFLQERHELRIGVSSELHQARHSLQRLLARQSVDELRHAHAEHERMQKELNTQKSRYAALVEQHKSETREWAGLQKMQKELTARLQQQETECAQTCSVREERQSLHERMIQALPASWRQRAAAQQGDELAALVQEQERLRRYLREAEDLARAQQERELTEARIAELTLQIEATPEPARQPLGAAHNQHEQAKAARQDADLQRQSAQSHLQELERHRNSRANYEQQLKAAERAHHLHKRLAKLLGREHLHRHLMRGAEQELVRLANETLGGLSRGRMHLLLRGQEPESDSGKGRDKEQDRALDLLFRNEETAKKPLDVALASGSQRFRIAISLALAIGRYFGRDSRRVESVIIDEGFGCLDKIGREDTIEVLRELQEELERIILVSHQDEFAAHFRSGYEIRLQDRSSVPVRMVG